MNLDYIWKKFNTTSFKRGRFYVVCMAVDKTTGKVVASAKNDLYPKKPKFKGHAEYILINILKSMEINLKSCYYIVSMDPCNGCLEKVFLSEGHKVDFDDIYIIHKKPFDCRQLKKVGRKHNILPKNNNRHLSVYEKIKKSLELNILDSDSCKNEY